MWEVGSEVGGEEFTKILNNLQRSSFEQSLKDTNSMPQKKTTQML